MFLYIVTDSKENASSHAFYRHKFILEKQANDLCIILHYSQISQELVQQLQPWAICHSGASGDFNDALQREEYRWLTREWMGAQIGFCGGHQIIAHHFGSTLGHMRELRESDADHSAGYYPGFYKEAGVYPIHLLDKDPLFEGLGNPIRVSESHMDEVKELGGELKLLASSENCRVQAYKHKTKPIYGTQFHPEASTQDYPNGFRILQNFFAIARKCNKVVHTP